MVSDADYIRLQTKRVKCVGRYRRSWTIFYLVTCAAGCVVSFPLTIGICCYWKQVRGRAAETQTVKLFR